MRYKLLVYKRQACNYIETFRVLSEKVSIYSMLDTPPGQWVGPKEWGAEGFFLALWGVPLNYIVMRQQGMRDLS
jgi:hypothetical protein